MSKNEIIELLDKMYWQIKMQLGPALKSRWFHGSDNCPGCGRPIKGMKWKGKNAVSVNTFIYREQGVLIGYLLCGKCARYIFKESEKDPIGQTDVHVQIEKTLKQAYLKQLGH